MPTEKASGRYRFSIFEVNLASGELLRQASASNSRSNPFAFWFC